MSMVVNGYTIECEADLRGANLCGANLRRADLRRADLRRADLRGADFRGADFRRTCLLGADLIGADLREANLSEANLSGAYLRGASLRGADFRGAYLEGADFYGADFHEAIVIRAVIDEPIARLDFGGWSVCVRTQHTSIGCKTKTNEFWLSAGPDDVARMSVGASEWWRLHGSAVKECIRVVQKKAQQASGQVTVQN